MFEVTRIISNIFFFLLLALSVAGQKDISPNAVSTTIIDTAGLRSMVKDSEKPLLVNFWATWCGPCRAEFPDLVKIDNENREKGLRFVIVSIDNATLADTAVSDFLRSYDARMPSYLLDFVDRRDLTRAIRRIAPRFSGTFPSTMLFNSAGKLVYIKNGVVNDRLLRAQIKRVLKSR
jgi:thiol-disulfide isomerase/thioredoxin